MSKYIEFQNRDLLEFSQFELDEKFSWLSAEKKKALDLFKAARLPNRKVEHWKYNDMTFLSGNSFQLAKASEPAQVAALVDATSKIAFDNAVELTFVDGFLISDLSAIPAIEGLTLTPFESANLAQQKTILEHLDPEFNQKSLLVNLNEVINQNGLLIEISANKKIQTPIYIRQIATTQKHASLSSQKLILQVASSSEATLIEQFNAETQSADQLSLQQTSVLLAPNSRLNHYRLNLENETARQVSQVKTSLQQDSTLNSFYLGFGSRLNRTDIDVLHRGKNAECNMTGIYLPANEQAIDYHTNIEHQISHCNTNEVFRGIIADKASATFNGKIHIFQDAQKSDAQLNNKNLLLTNQAEVNTKPELEIYADDVSCAHGATVAQLDNKSVYYLQTRGINRQKAKKMLSIAFVQELVNTVKLEPIKEYLGTLLDQHMSRVD